MGDSDSNIGGACSQDRAGENSGGRVSSELGSEPPELLRCKESNVAHSNGSEESGGKGKEREADQSAEEEKREVEHLQEEKRQLFVGTPTKEEAQTLILKRRPAGEQFSAQRHRQLEVLRMIAAPLQDKRLRWFPRPAQMTTLSTQH